MLALLSLFFPAFAETDTVGGDSTYNNNGNMMKMVIFDVAEAAVVTKLEFAVYNYRSSSTIQFALYEADEARIGRDLETQGQTRSMWGDTYVDLFFTDTAFHRSMAENVSYQPFGEAQIPVISAEDLLICKVLYDRPKDWVDIEAVAKTRGPELNTEYMRTWLAEAIGEADPRMDRMGGLLSE